MTKQPANITYQQELYNIRSI